MNSIELKDNYCTTKVIIDGDLEGETIDVWVKLFRTALVSLTFSQTLVDEYVPDPEE